VIALDTNVLVRYLADDEAKQAESTGALLDALTPTRPRFRLPRGDDGTPLGTEADLYGHSPERIAAVLEDLVATDGHVVEAAADVARSAMRYRRGVADFSDLMIAAAAERAGARPLYTFDRKAARLPDVALLAASAS